MPFLSAATATDIEQLSPLGVFVNTWEGALLSLEINCFECCTKTTEFGCKWEVKNVWCGRWIKFKNDPGTASGNGKCSCGCSSERVALKFCLKLS